MPGTTEKTDKTDWQAVMAEELIREEIRKEDGRYLVYYRFQARPGS